MKKIINFTMSLLVMLFVLPIFNLGDLNANSDWLYFNITYDGETHLYSDAKVNIIIDGEKLTDLAMEPIILNSRTLVPIRAIFEKTGAVVSWDGDRREAIIQKDNDVVIFKIDSNIATKNYMDTIILDVPAKIINSYTMVPVRAISDALGYEVIWEGSNRNVIINTNKEMETTSNIITETTTETTTFEIITETTTETTTNNVKTNNLKIVWDQVYGSTNDLPEKRNSIDGLDVLSPTWFAITNTNGDVSDIGSIEYSNWAKSQGYQLWGLVTNNFDANITTAVLSDYEKRTKVINQLVEYAKKYSLDGINIDFEGVASTDGEIYLQFIKEATEVFKSNNLVVSVDTFVPAPWTTQYMHEEVAKVVDYVIIMSYDEHYRTSSTSGSTASLPWVKRYMDEAIKLIPKDKLIMGIPFYTRLWTEKTNEDGSIEIISSVAVTMEEVENLIKDNNLSVIWLSDTKQNYIEYEEDGLVKKLWIEDEHSMIERMELASSYDLAGVACWKRGFETSNIWDIINSYF